MTEKQIEDFLDDFIDKMYPGKNHIVARKVFRDMFTELLPKHFDEFINGDILKYKEKYLELKDKVEKLINENN